MLRIIVYFLFIVSVGLAAAGIILGARLRSRYKSEFHSSLLYFLVFIFAFGFYGMWGQVLIRSLLSPVIKPEFIQRFSDLSILIGLPFLVFAWLMLLRFTSEITGRVFNSWRFVLFLFINLTTIVFIGWLITSDTSIKPQSIICLYYVIMNLIYCTASSILIFTAPKGKSVIHNFDKKALGSGIIIVSVLICTPLIFYDKNEIAGLVFILFFFTGNALLPFYLNYFTLATSSGNETSGKLTLEDFLGKYDISPRETDIVRELCNGLSNKEISEKLFISLQTVKDHTHRIYIKTNVRSRVQLITLVKEETGN